MRYFLSIFFTLFSTFTLFSCDQRDSYRHYSEVIIEPAAQPPMMNPHAQMQNIPMHDAGDTPTTSSPLSWTTPQGWSEQKSSGMRIATLTPVNDAKSVECTIVSLGAEAGSIAPNIVRWAGQIQVHLDAAGQKKFIDELLVLKTSQGFNVTVADFSSLLKSDTDPSMLAAILSLEGKTIFIKMTGPKNKIVPYREDFLSLCQSIRHE